MGFFSWLKSDDQKPVRNKWADDGPTPCKMLAPDGREWSENCYQGYGVFGGMDYYDLLAEINGIDDRDGAIAEAFEGRQPLKYPKIVCITCTKAWDDLPESRIADCQGYFDW